MDEQNNRPEGRKVTAEGTGKKLGKKGEGLGTGPVNNMGNYEDRAEQQAQQSEESSKPAAANRPQRPQPAAQQRPQSSSQQRPGSGSQRPAGQRPAAGNQRPAQGDDKSILSTLLGAGSQQQQQSSQNQSQNLASLFTGGSQNSSSQQQSGGTSLLGGNKKLILILVAAVVIFFLFRSMSGNNQDDGSTDLPLNTSSSQSASNNNDDLPVTTKTPKPTEAVNDLLSMFMGSSGSSAYDYAGTVSDSGGSASTSVSSGARAKYTQIKGKKKDTVTILVYMCGTDLESQSGMATADIKEMLNASVGSKVNLLVYTGGCRSWRNQVFSSQYNEIYQISDGQLTRLESGLSGSMTDPNTLASFIRYGSQNFPANRMCLILWDHGGGSVSGYGYDEKTGRGQSMTLAGINKALSGAGVKFDFIGFDACLMATVENGIMLSQHADYMIASEETEPGVGWYYTNWLSKLSANTSMSTVEIGKLITDDFVDVCAKQCRGQATTLSVVDLAELQATVPAELKDFSREATSMIKNNQYQKISKARANTREFARSSRIDQIDLADFATRLGTKESKELAKALKSAVKYNRTGGGITDAYGLSIYFPYQKASGVKNAVSAYQGIGMDEDYTRCIQEFASLEASGQVAASSGSGYSGYTSGQSVLPGLMDMLGGGTSSSGSYGLDLTDLLGDVLGGGSSSYGSMLDLFTGRDLTVQEAAEYVTAHHLDDSLLVWQNHQISLPADQADLINDIALNVFYDVGDSYLDLGMDDILYSWEGNTLTEQYSGVWLHFDDQPVAFYYMYKVSDNSSVGYVPVLLQRKGTSEQLRANLLILLEGGQGTIIGAQRIYGDEEKDTEAKNMIGIGSGDQVTFLCDCFGYDGKYQDTFPVGAMTLRDDTQIHYMNINGIEDCRVSCCLTDIYGQRHWTSRIDVTEK